MDSTSSNGNKNIADTSQVTVEYNTGAEIIAPPRYGHTEISCEEVDVV